MLLSLITRTKSLQKMANSYLKNLTQFKYLPATGTNQNFIREEI
jgi:hypothetical protein